MFGVMRVVAYPLVVGIVTVRVSLPLPDNRRSICEPVVLTRILGYMAVKSDRLRIFRLKPLEAVVPDRDRTSPSLAAVTPESAVQPVTFR